MAYPRLPGTSLILLVGFMTVLAAAQAPELARIYDDWGYNPYLGTLTRPVSEDNWPMLEKVVLGDDLPSQGFAVMMLTRLLLKSKFPTAFVHQRIAPLSERLTAKASLTASSTKPEAELYFVIARLSLIVKFRTAPSDRARLEVIKQALAERTDDAVNVASISSALLTELDHEQGTQLLQAALKSFRGWASLKERLRIGIDKIKVTGELDAAADSAERSRVAFRWLDAIPEKGWETEGEELYRWLMEELVRRDGAKAGRVLKRIWESEATVPLFVREQAQEKLFDLGVIGRGERTIDLIRD